MHLNPGALLVDRYRLVSRIATGGMGEVWEAVDDRLDRRVAVKVLKPEISADPEFLGRFRVEARTAAGLNHPGVAGVYDYGETRALEPGEQTTAYLVMELVEGEPLSAVLAREGRIETDRTLDVLEQTGRALQAAHTRGVVHRDVKPGNILITPDGRVKITDFGIAKAVDAAPVTRTGMVMGTAQYIAPEQALGQEAGPPSDVYALAVVGYECLAGRRPFSGDNALAVAMMHIRDTAPPLPSDVPRPVAELLRTAMVKDPDQRYRNGGEMADAVSAVRGGRRLPRPTGWVGAVQNPAPTRAMSAAPPTGARQTPSRAVPPLAAGPARPPATRAVRPPSTRQRSSAATGWLVFGGVLLVGLLALAGYLLLTGSGTTNRPNTPPGTSATVTTTPTTSTAPTTTAPTTTNAPTTSNAPTTTTAPTTTNAPTTTEAPTTSNAPTTTTAPTSGAGTS